MLYTYPNAPQDHNATDIMGSHNNYTAAVHELLALSLTECPSGSSVIASVAREWCPMLRQGDFFST